MAQYNVQDPQGNMRVIEGPDGASDAEIISQAQKLFGQSGGMNPINGANKLQSIRDSIRPTPTSMAAEAVASQIPIPGIKMALRAAFPHDTIQSPQNAFAQDQKTGNAQDTTIPDAFAAQSIYSIPSAARSMAGLIDSGASQIGKVLSAPRIANELAPAEDAVSAGVTANTSRLAQKAAIKGAVNDAYAKIPKDFLVKTPTVQSAADDVINAIKSVPAEFQSGKVPGMASALQNLGDKGTNLKSLQIMRTELTHIARNGEGAEKMFAANLADAITKDVEAAGNASIIQRPASMAETDLRSLWTDSAKQTLQQGLDDKQAAAHFINPDAVAGLNNSDVPQNLNKANALFSSMKDVLDHPTAQALAKTQPEKFTSTLFRPSATVEDLGVAKTVLGPVGFNSVQGQFYQKLVNAKNIETEMAKYSPQFLNEALGPQKITALKNLAKFKELVSKVATGVGATGLGGAFEVGRRLLK